MDRLLTLLVLNFLLIRTFVELNVLGFLGAQFVTVASVLSLFVLGATAASFVSLSVFTALVFGDLRLGELFPVAFFL